MLKVSYMENLNKFTVIGAGPSGLTFAYQALLRGYDVKIYEGRNVFAYKPCGEALAADSLIFTPFNLNSKYKWMLNEMKFVKIYYNGKYYRTIKSPFGERGYIINKRLFLQEFADYLIKKGVKIETGKFYKPEKEEFIIDASGYLTYSRNKEIFKEVYIKDYRSIPVIRDYSENNGLLDDGYLLIDLLDRGYFWIFPYGKDRYNIGIGGIYDGDTLKRIYEKKIKKYDLKLIKGTRQGASVSIGGPISKNYFGRHYIIGEAAGYVMPTTGEGIRFSIYSAYEFFDRNSEFIRNIKSRLRFNAKLLRLAINIEPKIKDKLIKQAPENLLMVFLGEKTVNTKDIIEFFRIAIKSVPIRSIQNAFYSVMTYLIKNRVDTKDKLIKFQY